MNEVNIDQVFETAASAGEALSERIENRTAVAGIVGLGYVGLPIMHTFHSESFPVLGFDIDGVKVDEINARIRTSSILGRM